MLISAYIYLQAVHYIFNLLQCSKMKGIIEMSYFNALKELLFCCFLFVWKICSEIYIHIYAVIKAFIIVFIKKE